MITVVAKDVNNNNPVKLSSVTLCSCTDGSYSDAKVLLIYE